MSQPAPKLCRPQLYSISNPSSAAQIAGGTLYIDTSSIIDLLGDPQSTTLSVDLRNQSELQSFITQSATAGTVLTYSYKTLEELAYAVTRGWFHAMRSAAAQTRKGVRALHANFMGNVVAEVRKLKTAIENLANMENIDYCPSPSMFEDVLTIMERDNVEYADAFQYNLCAEHGITDILTSDADYMEIQDPRLRIFTTTLNYRRLQKRYRIGGPRS